MNSSSISRIAFWGLCSIGLLWMAATLAFEMHMGLPTSGIAWAKRTVGWGLECLLIRALVLGVRRYYSGPVAR